MPSHAYTVLLKRLLPLVLAMYALSGGAHEGYNVLILETMPVKVVLEGSQAFQAHINRLATEADDAVHVRVFNAMGDPERAEAILGDELNRREPDVVVTVATMATQTAYRLLQDTSMPVVFLVVADPVGAGVVKTIGEPTHSGITGVVHTIARHTKIEMVLRLLDQVTSQRPIKIGFVHSTYPSSVGDLTALRENTTENELQFIGYSLPYREMPAGLADMLSDVRDIMATAVDEVDYFWEPAGPLAEREEYNRLMVELSDGKVVFGNTLDSVKSGALLYVSPQTTAEARQAANMTYRVLQGQDAGTIPVSYPNSFEFGLNIKTAQTLGIVIPPDMMKLAGERIYR